MMWTGKDIKNKLIFLAAAILPVFFMLIAYVRMGIYPFGDKTVYTWDLEAQYSSFMVLMHNLLSGKEQLNYSLTGGLGGNLYGLAAYYLGSPFNIIMVFFNEKTMPAGIMILILLKTAGMGFFMFLYLQKKKQSPVAILFSTAYALSAYAIAYQSNIMWLDALVFLPLVILGLESMIREGKCLLYIVSLGLTIISNYFIAYMACLFVVFYFVGYMLFIEWKESGLRKKLRTIGQFAVSSLCGGGLSAFLLMPMLCEMQNGISKVNVTADAVKNGARLFYYRSILPMFMACSYDNSQRWDVIGTFPLFYCGIIAVLGVILFFISRNITWKNKIFQAFLMLMLLVSCNHMNLFFIWHGFYTPFGAPWRFMFLWGFVILTAAHEGIASALEEKSRRYDYMALTGICVYFLWVFWRFISYRRIVIFNVGIMVCEVIGFLLCKYKKRYVKAAAVWLCVLAVGAELICNALYTWNQGFEYESYLTYQDHISRMADALSREEGIFRSVMKEGAKRNLNDGFLWNVNTVESYASTVKRKTWETGRYLDLGEYRIMGTYNTKVPLLTQNIVSLKYIYGGETADEGYEKVKATQDGINVYKNDNVLPFGFLVNKTALEITAEDRDKDICEKQNALFHALAGSQGMEKEEIYKKVSDEEKNVSGEEISEQYMENTELVQKATAKTAEYTLSVTSKTVSDVTSKVRNDLGETAYVCYSVPFERGWKAEVDGREAKIMGGMGGFLLVPVEDGEHEVRIIYTAPGSRAGMMISLICFAGVIIYALYGKKKSSYTKEFRME